MGNAYPGTTLTFFSFLFAEKIDGIVFKRQFVMNIVGGFSFTAYFLRGGGNREERNTQATAQS